MSVQEWQYLTGTTDGCLKINEPKRNQVLSDTACTKTFQAW
jgi:hypothetical protein